MINEYRYKIPNNNVQRNAYFVFSGLKWLITIGM